MKAFLTKLSYLSVWLAVFLVELVPCPVMGQGITKKQLTVDDYGKWGTLRSDGISDDGAWISYRTSYPSGADTLFVKNTRTGLTYSFPQTLEGRFAGTKHFASLTGDNLKITALADGTSIIIANVTAFDIAKNGTHIVASQANGDNSASLLICHRNGNVQATLHGIKSFRLSDAKEALLYCASDSTGHSIGILDLANPRQDKKLLSGSVPAFDKLTWSDDANAVAFQSTSTPKCPSAGKLYLYLRDTATLYHITDDPGSPIPEGRKLSADTGLRIRISSDNKLVFFGIDYRDDYAPDSLPANVEIWKADDTLLYPMRREVALLKKKPGALAVWDTQSGKVLKLSTRPHRWALLTADARYAILPGNIVAASRFADAPSRDYYLAGTRSGETVLLETLQGQEAYFSTSPNGKYIAYYDEHNWWVYDTNGQTRHNITDGIDAVWDSAALDPDDTLYPFGVAGWTREGNILLYDSNDLWSVSPVGKNRERITKGRESNTIYRLAPDVNATVHYKGYAAYSGRVIDIRNRLFLSATCRANGEKAFYMRSPNGRLKVLTTGKKKVDRLWITKSGNSIMYEAQDFETPPHIVYKYLTNNTEKIVAASNTHHHRYFWGHAERITYSVDADTLSGALIYPANYNKGTSYPMIVYIYEKMSQEGFVYVNPSQFNSIGLNIANLTAEGYFVLLPDIRYRNGEPGESALDCVAAAVEKAIAAAGIDRGRIGLAGHSFGGYETNYILTRTDIFAAAISGASIADPISSYLSYSPDTGLIDYWRYEDHQFRIGKSLYEDTEKYLSNSPVLHAANIVTPLLTWAGKDDPIVRPAQSLQMYAALRRLGRKHVMLLYPDEGHTLGKKENQADLTMRVQDWFDYFLKGKPVLWIEKG